MTSRVQVGRWLATYGVDHITSVSRRPVYSVLTGRILDRHSSRASTVPQILQLDRLPVVVWSSFQVDVLRLEGRIVSGLGGLDQLRFVVGERLEVALGRVLIHVAVQARGGNSRRQRPGWVIWRRRRSPQASLVWFRRQRHALPDTPVSRSTMMTACDAGRRPNTILVGVFRRGVRRNFTWFAVNTLCIPTHTANVLSLQLYSYLHGLNLRP